MSLLDLCINNHEFPSTIRSCDVKRFAAKIKEDLAPEEALSDQLVILDIGSGFGDSAFALREHFPNSRIIGIDINTPALEKAKHRIMKENHTRIDLFTLDITDPDFITKFETLTQTPPGSIHLAWSAYLVSQLTTADRIIAMQNIQNILANKGRMYLLDFIWSETDKIMVELNCMPEYRPHISAPEFVQDPRIFEQPRDRDFSQKWLRSLDTLDFEVLQIVSNKLHYQITSLSNMIKVLDQLCPTLNFISDEQKRMEYFLEFFKRTFDKILLPGSRSKIAYHNLLICARKIQNNNDSDSLDTISL